MPKKYYYLGLASYRDKFCGKYLILADIASDLGNSRISLAPQGRHITPGSPGGTLDGCSLMKNIILKKKRRSIYVSTNFFRRKEKSKIDFLDFSKIWAKKNENSKFSILGRNFRNFDFFEKNLEKMCFFEKVFSTFLKKFSIFFDDFFFRI